MLPWTSKAKPEVTMGENIEFYTVHSILRSWDEEHQSPNYDPVPMLNKLSKLIESKTEIYMKMNPDPFDERHPYIIAYPNCSLGYALKRLLTNELFMTKLVNVYLCGTHVCESTAACRLLLNVTLVLQTDDVDEILKRNVLLQMLFSWAEKSVEPLQTYATGLLAVAMETEENFESFEKQNFHLAPLLLERLRNLHAEPLEEKEDILEISAPKDRRLSTNDMMSPPSKPKPAKPLFSMSDCYNSLWTETETIAIGNVQVDPLTKDTKTIFILKYLTQICVENELITHIFEQNIPELMMQLISLRETKNSRLLFEAVGYLATWFSHKPLAIEFIKINGLQKLLKVPKRSIAATDVSLCLHCLAYFSEDVMERVCLLPKHVLTDLVKYSLWLLKCTHGRIHATRFFGLSFQFRVILEQFDAHDGLRKLLNVISTLPIFNVGNPGCEYEHHYVVHYMFEHVCFALERYFKAHLYFKSEQVRRTQIKDSVESSKVCSTLPSYKAFESNPDEVREQLSVVLDHMFFHTLWPPVDNFVHLGGISLLAKNIAFKHNDAGRVNTVRRVLDVLNICSVMPRIQLQLCEKVELPDGTNTAGMNVILSAAEGAIITDPDVQKAALHVLITCACAHFGGSVARYSAGDMGKNKIDYFRSNEGIIEKMWECLRTNNGIMRIINLIKCKEPIAHADSLRALACQALAGFARSERVRQFISKLPFFRTGQFQSLMRTPISQDRRQEHAMFQKHGYELIERFPEKSKSNNESVLSLTNIHKANASCNNPMAPCPQFTLFEPHICPDPILKNKVPQNFVMRYTRGIYSKRLDQRLIHSKFCGVRIFWSGDDRFYVMSCDFFGDDKHVAIGTNHAEIKLFNLQNGAEVSNHYWMGALISHVQASRKHSLLLASSNWLQRSSCWEIKNNIFDPVLSMMNEKYVEFNKLTEDRIIGTKAQTATIYDIETKRSVQVLKPTSSNEYIYNRATFCPTNKLVLSDGVLWDVNSGKEIHMFDKLNQTISGVFHPNGLEIVANTEVWDLRTYHLLRTVPALDQCALNFSPLGNTMYSFTLIERDAVEDNHCLRTYDAYDYSSIVSFDVKKNIYDLACNGRDTQIALVENQGVFNDRRGSYLKIYDLGRSKTAEEESEDDEDDED